MMTRLLNAVVCAIALGSCSNSTNPGNAPRAYRLGFSATPPRLELASVLATIEAWRPRGDIALHTLSVPWKSMLADTSAAFLVRRDVAELVALYKSRNLPVIVQVDATDGLARDKEAPELVAAGRSISEPAIQTLYREYILAVDSILRPEYFGLAMETNLVRAIAPSAVYQSLRTMTNAAASALSGQQSTAWLFVSVQVETAWGRLPATPQFVGVDQDRIDFPFITALGLSSYPFLGGFAEPEDVPLEYYERLSSVNFPSLPMLVVEGGWSSASVPGVTSSAERQARWIARQMALADRAPMVAVTQITYTDLDLTTYPVPAGSILPLFANLGLVDTQFAAKPALAEWDRAFQRPLCVRPGCGS